MSDFKDRLAFIMNLRSINQATLSSTTGIPKSAISQYLSGQFKPRPKRVNVLCEALGTTPAWLLALDESTPPSLKEIGYTPLSEEEIRLIAAYRINPMFRKKIDILMTSEENKSVFRAAKSQGGNVPPTHEPMSAEHLKRLAEAPETDEDI